MNKTLRALIVEDSESAALSLVEKLQQGGFDTHFERVQTARTLREALAGRSWDIIFCDYSMPGFSGEEALIIYKETRLDIPFIIVSGKITEETARDAMLAGAHDYLTKGNLTRLIPVVSRELHEAAMRLERRRTHKALEQNERLFRTMLEAAPSATIIANIQGQITLVNSRTVEMFGYANRELLGKSILQLIPQHFFSLEENRREEELSTLAAQPIDVSLELFGLRKDGSRFPLEVRSSFVQADHGIFVINFVTDITVRKQAEERIREQAALLDKAQDAIAVVGLDNAITYWNQGAERLFGWSAEEAAERNAEQLLFNKPSTQLGTARREVLARGEWVGELRHFNRSGAEIVVQNRWTLIRDEESTPQAILFIGTDQTEKKRLEEQFLRSQRLEMIGALAGGIAHDINNVFQPILMAVQMLLMDMPDPNERRMYENIERNINRGAAMLQQVSKFVRGSSGDRMPLQPKYLLKEISSFIRETFSPDIEVRLNLPRDLWKISGDMTSLHQMILIICIHSRDRMKAGGMLTLSAENRKVEDIDLRMIRNGRPGRFVMITISDSGTGISPDHQKILARPASVAEEGHEIERWLSQAGKILTHHEGFLDLYSIEGKGSSIKLFLPGAPSESVSAPAIVDLQPPVGNGQLILVVDDETYIRNLLNEILLSFGYKVIMASDGREAIDLFRQHAAEIDLILMDMLMPNMSGEETIRMLKSESPEVLIVAASGLPENEQRLYENKTAMVERFLIKPYTAEKVLNTFHEIFAAQKKPPI